MNSFVHSLTNRGQGLLGTWNKGSYLAGSQVNLDKQTDTYVSFTEWI